MNTTKKYEPREKVELHGTLAEFRQALEEEIEAIKKRGLSSTLLTGGVQISNQTGKYCYKYNADFVPVLPADTPCKLIIGQNQYTVTTVSFDEETITLASEQPLPDGFSQARLENGSTVLMECMIKCIEENASETNPAGKRMLSFDDQGIDPCEKIESYDIQGLRIGKENNDNQKAAIVSALTNNITYIWGPPGTGKTKVIGQIIDKLQEKDRSVLVVSHTNTAVDGAIEKAAESYQRLWEINRGTKAPYPILRIGKSVKQLPVETTLEFHIKMNGQELYEQKQQLENTKANLQDAIHIVRRKQKQIEWVESTQLPSIPGHISALEAADKALQTLRKRTDSLQSRLLQEKELHPEVEQYIALSAILEKTEQHHNDVEQQLNTAQEVVRWVPNQIQLAKDEIKRHVIYAELLAKEAKTFSSVFINRELASISEKIQNLQTQMGVLRKEHENHQRTISDYEKKGAIGKFFAGKSGIAQARIKLAEIDVALSELQKEFNKNIRLGDDYQEKLRERLDLEAQLRRMKPAKTKEYWEQMISDLTQQLNQAQAAIPKLDLEKKESAGKSESLRRRVSECKKEFDHLQSLEKELRESEDAYRKARAKLSQMEAELKEIFTQEYAFCQLCVNEKLTVSEASLTDQYQTLKSYLTAVSEKIQTENKKSLEEQYTKLSEQLTDIFKQLRAIEESMGELEKQSIMQAKVIGATLTKAYLSTILRERTFDTVILDEASMAAVPALWCAAYLAERNIVIVGDFLQLPPIVIADTPMAKKWLGRDIFDHSGMQRKAKKDSPSGPPSNFIMLNEQYRMEPEIAEIANRYYDDYKKLESRTGPEFRQEDINKFSSWFPVAHPKHNVQLIDTESLHAWVTGIPQGKGHSRLNCFSAAIAVNLAFKCIEKKLDAYLENSEESPEKPLVLIVAPYKPHITLVNKLIQAEYVRRGLIKKENESSVRKDELNFIQAGTIHSFQGSEADIVIFDLVIDEPHWKANLFMNNFSVKKPNGEVMEVKVNEDLQKMFNVAVTRAKFQLFIIGDFEYCMERTKKSKNNLHDLLRFLIDEKKYPRQEAKALFPELSYTPPTSRKVDNIDPGQTLICTDTDFNDHFMRDLKNFQNRMIIYSAFMSENRLSILLPAFTDAVSQGKEIIIVTKDLSERGKAERSAYERCEKELRSLGDKIKIIHKHGMHEKLILVDDDVIWMGSLNALSFTGKTGEVMERRCSQKLVKEYEKMYDIPHISQALNSGYEMSCPICGGEMLVRESDEGGIYWQCVNKDYSRSAEQPYPKDGILRCHCGSKYTFSMKKEPRWICESNPRHYQKMRESDLKLDQMRSLIPRRELKTVEKYFSERRKEREKKSGIKRTPKVQENQQITLFD